MSHIHCLCVVLTLNNSTMSPQGVQKVEEKVVEMGKWVVLYRCSIWCCVNTCLHIPRVPGTSFQNQMFHVSGVCELRWRWWDPRQIQMLKSKWQNKAIAVLDPGTTVTSRNKQTSTTLFVNSTKQGEGMEIWLLTWKLWIRPWFAPVTHLLNLQFIMSECQLMK